MKGVRLSINFKITALFLMLSLLMIAAVGFIDFNYTRADFEKRVLSDLIAVSNAKATNIKTLVEEDFEDALDVATRIMIREALTDLRDGFQDPEQLRRRISASMQSTKESSKTIKDISIIGIDGRVVSATTPGNIDKDLSESVFFVQGKKGLYLSVPYQYKGVFIYEISTPIFGIGSAENEIVGVARVMIDETRLFDILRSYSGLGETGETVLGMRKGDDILFIGPLRHRQNLKTKLRIPFSSDLATPMRLALEKKSGIVTGRDYRGAEVLAAYYYSPISGWGVVVKIDKREAFAPIETLRIQLLLFSGFLFLVSALAIMRLVIYITTPIKKLREGIMVVADGDLDYRVNVATGDELGDLAESFNEMAAHLKKVTVSVDRLNKEVAERRKAEEQLAEALKVKSNFIQTVSHELRTPLAAVYEGISIVLDGILGKVNEEQISFLTKTKTNVQRLTRLINEILDFQRLESGKMRMSAEENDINSIATEVYEVMNPLAKSKNTGFTLALDGGLPKIKFDRDRISQVFTNLIDNAIKFTDKGSISVTTCRDAGGIHVIVRDSGRGIAREDMERLFKSFEQLGRGSDRRGGTGLGLVISKDIVQLHGGSIWAESGTEKGAAFHFTLPLGTE